MVRILRNLEMSALENGAHASTSKAEAANRCHKRYRQRIEAAELARAKNEIEICSTHVAIVREAELYRSRLNGDCADANYTALIKAAEAARRNAHAKIAMEFEVEIEHARKEYFASDGWIGVYL
jgi:hypothetical protein